MMVWKKNFIFAFLAQVLSILGFSFAMPFLPFFIAELGVFTTGEQAFWSGIMLSVPNLTLAVFSPLWGILADRYGRKVMVCRSMFGGAVILVLISFARTVEQLLVYRILQGALTGTIAASIALVASVTPPHRSGFTLGMMQAAVYVGTALGPVFGGIVADHFGYRAAFQAGAAIVFLGGVLVYAGIRENFMPPDPVPSRERAGFIRILKTGGFLAAVMVMFGVRFSSTIMNPSFPLIVMDILPSAENLNSITGAVLASAALAGALSAGILGHTGDRFGHKKILVACCFFSAAAAGAHFYARSIPFLLVAHIMFAFSLAGMMPAANAMIYNAIDRGCVGKAYGAATALSMTGAAFGPFMGGYFSRMAGLRMPFVLTASAQVLLGTLIASFSKKSRAEKPGTLDPAGRRH